jgi:hypothetical protein
MVGPRPKSPGWYTDPDIVPGSTGPLRYWNGRQWTDRRRPRPILADLDLRGPLALPVRRALEGPVRAVAELPAPAAEVAATRDAPSGRAETIERPTGTERHGIELSPSTGGGSGVPPRLPGPGGGGGGGDGADDGSSDPSIRSRRRKKWWFVAALAVVAALAATLAGESLRPPSPGPRVLTDSNFVKLANNECARTMPDLRPPDGGPMGSAVSPTKVADQADQAATGLDALANRLAALPAAAVDQPHIASWLDGWHQYAAVGRQYADYLRQHGASGQAPAVLNTGATLAKTSDNFARANGLDGCLFAFAYNPDPSQF